MVEDFSVYLHRIAVLGPFLCSGMIVVAISRCFAMLGLLLCRGGVVVLVVLVVEKTIQSNSES